MEIIFPQISGLTNENDILIIGGDVKDIKGLYNLILAVSPVVGKTYLVIITNKTLKVALNFLVIQHWIRNFK